MKNIIENIKGFLVLWGVIVVANQVVLFGACFAPYCLVAAVPHTFAIAIVLSYFFLKANDTKKEGELTKNSKTISQTETTKRQESFQQPENDALKQRGDGYELYIGRKFELKGDLVIYNGLIRGYEDQGVDIIVLSSSTLSVNLIQCKHWKKREFTKGQLAKIYDNLNNFSPDYQSISPENIEYYLSNKRNKAYIQRAVQEGKSYSTIHKTLYLSSNLVIQSDVWPLLEVIKKNIYRYKSMKVVVHEF